MVNIYGPLRLDTECFAVLLMVYAVILSTLALSTAASRWRCEILGRR